MPNPSVAKNKIRLRKQLQEIVVADPATASQAIVETLAILLGQHPEWQCIALYAALPGEPDLSALPTRFSERRFVYPRMQGDFMTFHRVCDPEKEMITGPWGLREPMGSMPHVSGQDIDVMLCPGMAFTRDGKRLGKGKGYYDRFLEACAAPRPHCIGLCFSEFVREDLPSESHDFRMDQLVSNEDRNSHP